MDIHRVYQPFLLYFRRKRIRKFYESFEISETTTLLDIGGSMFIWNLAKEIGLPQPKITMLNLHARPDGVPENVEWVRADGTRLPFGDHSFDIAFSNSVIEHLYDWGSQVKFAGEIRRVSQRFYVQTPSKYCLVEPHYITPFIHWLPKSWQRRLLKNFTVWGLLTRPTKGQCEELVAEIRLLNRREMKKLFPESVLEIERFLGLEKSIIAVKSA